MTGTANDTIRKGVRKARSCISVINKHALFLLVGQSSARLLRPTYRSHCLSSFFFPLLLTSLPWLPPATWWRGTTRPGRTWSASGHPGCPRSWKRKWKRSNTSNISYIKKNIPWCREWWSSLAPGSWACSGCSRPGCSPPPRTSHHRPLLLPPPPPPPPPPSPPDGSGPRPSYPALLRLPPLSRPCPWEGRGPARPRSQQSGGDPGALHPFKKDKKL